MPLKQLIGILAALAIGHDAAFLFAQSADKLRTEFQSLGIGIGGDVDACLVLEVGFDEVIQVRQVLLCAVRHADHIVPSRHDEREGIHFALGDDALRGVADVVDAPRHEPCILFEHEVLRPVAVLAVHEFALHGVGKDDALLNFIRLRHGAANFNDAFRFGCFGRDSSVREPPAHIFVERFLVGEATGFLTGPRLLPIFRLRCVCYFLGLAEEEACIAMVAVGDTPFPIDRQRLVLRMMLPFFVTFRTELLLLPVIGKAEVFQFFVVYFHNRYSIFLPLAKGARGMFHRIWFSMRIVSLRREHPPAPLRKGEKQLITQNS